MNECAVCGLPSPDEFDHEECFDEGSLTEDEIRALFDGDEDE